MASNPDPQPKKRESRAGTRKVTSLSAEQLERKRANDREAQRTIRQRTKEHIERLEHQVAELKSKGEQYDHVVRRNTALENEIRALKQQLALARSGQAYSSPAEGSYNTPSGPVLPSQFPEPLSVNPVSRTPSALSASSQVSVVPDWQQYGSTGSPSICESSDADYSNRVEPFIFEGQLQTSNPMPVAAPQASFNTPSGHPAESSFHSYSHLYPGGVPNQVRRGEHPHNPQHNGNFVGTQLFTPRNSINKSRNSPQETITVMTGLVDSDSAGKWSLKVAFLHCGLNVDAQIQYRCPLRDGNIRAIQARSKYSTIYTNPIRPWDINAYAGLTHPLPW
ncbi:hypothetical protein ABOM_008817 [Aspergillus bombycis]|uniref:BZIP transcription factor n=1 Tax=Aspergillus bombycis TaxID=109264 RepID=A0A1F7ZW54_9EURO|nr:hypothetical protein ABOM_008817 [Aspergillus bombycis]OGM43680.1 hypothetical protein ABOM_008817 [Aspergillus bombycis]